MCFLLLEKSLDEMKHKTVYMVGLGYVGLPLAKAFVIENRSM
jgi:UDP-N-acetyl-D-mannosaminuronate dehydrogenase